jgi:hypothetical protein
MSKFCLNMSNNIYMLMYHAYVEILVYLYMHTNTFIYTRIYIVTVYGTSIGLCL